MEKKTLGTFLAALRRASGMTQRELAERLNVSDKAVSRWERDDAAPDITLIPVIAEIFGVTADELLRGERLSAERAEDPPANSAVKAEKQLKYLIDSSLSKFSSRQLIVYGLSAAGLVIAAIFNLALLKGLIGLCIAELIFVVAACCLAYFTNNAISTVRSDEFDDEILLKYRKDVLRKTALAVYAIALPAAFCMPLCILKAYQGLNATSWLKYGIICLGLSTVLCFAGRMIFRAVARKKGLLPPRLIEKNPERTKKNRRLAAVILAVLIPVLLLEGHTHAYLKKSEYLSNGTSFYSIDEFVQYMNNKARSSLLSDSFLGEDTWNYGSNGLQWNLGGNGIKTENVLDDSGNLICCFEYVNELPIYSIGPKARGYLPITVYDGEPLNYTIAFDAAMYALYFVEVLAAAAIYKKKRTE